MDKDKQRFLEDIKRLIKLKIIKIKQNIKRNK